MRRGTVWAWVSWTARFVSPGQFVMVTDIAGPISRDHSPSVNGKSKHRRKSIIRVLDRFQNSCIRQNGECGASAPRSPRTIEPHAPTGCTAKCRPKRPAYPDYTNSENAKRNNQI